MRKFTCLALAVIMVTSILFGCSTPVNTTEPTTVPTVPTETEPTGPKTYNILFIGNSYTNEEMPYIFKELATAAGYDVNVFSVVQGSWGLAEFSNPNDQYGKHVEAHLTGDRQYDFIVLQEKSLLPATEPATLYTNVRNLHARISAKGAQTILFSTWGRQTGSTALKDNGLTNESMTWKVAASYQAIGRELNIPVAHVGLAFFDIYTGGSKIDIYDTDRTHPNYAGNYISAMTLFATMFNIDPTTIPYDGDLTPEKASVLREAVRKAVFETPEIPDIYKTSSEGIG